MEIWKDVKGYKGYYQISNKGRVKSLRRFIYDKNGQKRIVYEKILKQSLTTTGYYRVNLKKKNISKTKKIHQMMAESFLGHKPNGFKLVVDHINNNPLDNRIENLQIVTNRVNTSKDKKGSSKYTGVCWCNTNKIWVSHIRHNGKKINLGRFKNEYDAHLAYQKKLKEIKF